MPLPPRPNTPHVMRAEEEQTPIGTRASITELNANTAAIGRLTAEVADARGSVEGMREWCGRHDGQHITLETKVSGVDSRVGRIEGKLDTFEAAAKAVVARHPITTGQIKAYGAIIIGVATVVVGGLTQWRVAQASAESRKGAELATKQEYDRRAEADRQRSVVLAAEEGAKRALAMHEQAELDAKVRAEAAANMRVAPTRGKR